MRMGTPAARWVLLATVLGSGVAFLDGTIVNVALPAIADDLDADLGDLQWVLDALPRHAHRAAAPRRRRSATATAAGGCSSSALAGFTAASVLCGVAPNVELLDRAPGPLQGVGAALLVPGSLAIISASVPPRRPGAAAVGAWSGLGGVASAIGPVRRRLADRQRVVALAFLVNVPVRRRRRRGSPAHVPETRGRRRARPPRRCRRGPRRGGGPGRSPPTASSSRRGWSSRRGRRWPAGAASALRRASRRRSRDADAAARRCSASRQFSGANATTLAVYAGARAARSSCSSLELQVVLGYSALEAGSALLPGDRADARCSRRAPGALAQRIGPRLPMTVGPLGVAAGLLLWAQVDAGRPLPRRRAARARSCSASACRSPSRRSPPRSWRRPTTSTSARRPGINNAVARLAGPARRRAAPARRRPRHRRSRRRRSTAASTTRHARVGGRSPSLGGLIASPRSARVLVGGHARPSRHRPALRRPVPQQGDGAAADGGLTPALRVRDLLEAGAGGVDDGGDELELVGGRQAGLGHVVGHDQLEAGGGLHLVDASRRGAPSAAACGGRRSRSRGRRGW